MTAKPAIKRGPGRPPGVKNSPKNAENSLAEPVKRKPGRPPGTRSKPVIADPVKAEEFAEALRQAVVKISPEIKAARAAANAAKKDPMLEPDVDVVMENLTPLEFLERHMNDPRVPMATRTRCAIAAARYRHTARDDGGKKEQQADEAAKATQDGSKFAPQRAPRGAQLQ